MITVDKKYVQLTEVLNSKFYAILFPLDKYPEMGLLDHAVILCKIFWETCVVFSLVGTSVYIPIIIVQVFHFSKSLPMLVTSFR